MFVEGRAYSDRMVRIAMSYNVHDEASDDVYMMTESVFDSSGQSMALRGSKPNDDILTSPLPLYSAAASLAPKQARWWPWVKSIESQTRFKVNVKVDVIGG